MSILSQGYGREILRTTVGAHAPQINCVPL
jgi:hypothetical protein